VRQTLENISDIQPGYAFREGVQDSIEGSLSIVQMRDLTSDNRLALGNMARLDLSKVKDDYFLSRNDLVFRSRGASRTAAIVDTDVRDTILSFPLIRIRVNGKKAMPEYVRWFINNTGQSYLDSHSEGTSIKMVNKKTLADMPIDIPPVDMQKKIVELSAVAETEQRLMRELMEKRGVLFQGILRRLIAEESG
jgi:hypothetical protein